MIITIWPISGHHKNIFVCVILICPVPCFPLSCPSPLKAPTQPPGPIRPSRGTPPRRLPSLRASHPGRRIAGRALSRCPLPPAAMCLAGRRLSSVSVLSPGYPRHGEASMLLPAMIAHRDNMHQWPEPHTAWDTQPHDHGKPGTTCTIQGTQEELCSDTLGKDGLRLAINM